MFVQKSTSLWKYLVRLQGLDTCDLVPRLGAADVVRCIFETNEVSPKNCYELAHNRSMYKKTPQDLRCLVGLQGLEPWTYRL